MFRRSDIQKKIPVDGMLSLSVHIFFLETDLIHIPDTYLGRAQLIHISEEYI